MKEKNDDIIKFSLLISNISELIVFLIHLVIGYDVIFDIIIISIFIIFWIINAIVNNTKITLTFLILYGIFTIMALALPLSSNSISNNMMTFGNIICGVPPILYAILYFVKLKSKINKNNSNL